MLGTVLSLFHRPALTSTVYKARKKKDYINFLSINVSRISCINWQLAAVAFNSYCAVALFLFLEDGFSCLIVSLFFLTYVTEITSWEYSLPRDCVLKNKQQKKGKPPYLWGSECHSYRLRRYSLLKLLHCVGSLYLSNENIWKLLPRCGMKCTASLLQRILHLLGTHTVLAILSLVTFLLAEMHYIT